MRMRRFLLVAYVLAVAVGAGVAVALLPGAGLTGSPWPTVLMASLAMLMGAKPVRIPSLKTELIATEPFMLYGLAALGPLPAAVISFAGVLGTVAGRAKRPSILRLVFNVGAVVLSTALAAGVFLLLRGKPGGQTLEIIWPLAAATASYYILNTGLVAGAVALEKSESYLNTWRKSYTWAASSFFTGMTVAVALLVILQTLGPWGLFLGIPPTWLVIAYYRAYKGRLDEQRRRNREVEALNAELHSTVEQLQEALAHVKRLQGLLPICMHCKKIRDDKDTWHRLENYIAENSEASFTHSLCEECRTAHYPHLLRRRRVAGLEEPEPVGTPAGDDAEGWSPREGRP